jgi:hypothetical protein
LEKQERRKPITEQEIMAKMSPRGSWTREQLEEWKVPWPPPPGWKKWILKHGIPYEATDEG